MTIDTQELRRLHGAATAGEWEVQPDMMPRFDRSSGETVEELQGFDIRASGGEIVGCEGINGCDQGKRDAAAIVAFKNAISELCDAADRLARIEAVLVDAEKALKPFATILPSSLYAGDGSDNEGYCVLLAPINGNPTEYTGRDLANARAALAALRELIGGV